MARLTVEAVLKEKQAPDADSITAVSLTHKALADVSCLGGFVNLERLDLTFNNLTSLEGLGLCVNLKWLSVVENKLQSLKGVEGLTKLTVMNAGKNKLRSMVELKNLTNLRALILNDNEISSIDSLDKLKDLNTLVLSRNPIQKLGRSLARLKSVTKISLSNCGLEGIDSSIKGCTELKELRLGHNLIKTLPADMAHVTKLQNLDLGNNLIKSWSELKVLSSLQRLESLNLQGNPVAEKNKLVNKINKLVPCLRIYNNKPMEKFAKRGKDNDNEHDSVRQNGQNGQHIDEKVHEDDSTAVGKKRKSKIRDAEESFSLVVGEKELKQEELTDQPKKKKNLKEPLMSQSIDNSTYYARDDKGKGKEKNKKKAKEDPKTEALEHDSKKRTTENSSKQKAGLSVLDIIDDGEAPFSDLLDIEAQDNLNELQGERDDKGAHARARNKKEVDVVVTLPDKRRRTKSPGTAGSFPVEYLAHAAEVGLGGLSAWGDE